MGRGKIEIKRIENTTNRRGSPHRLLQPRPPLRICQQQNMCWLGVLVRNQQQIRWWVMSDGGPGGVVS
ncbi:hypothetical protein CK203_105463 [Vitis vinifera]|uniref:MADS-box domain-containing protein n=1 Tax=Vitis vinifera TaxID=29760 RepID=A0A438CDQ4_VITVI|nr:hypothetical protein CK203_105463 [Vitis vinifera]